MSDPTVPPPSTQPLRFVRRGAVVTLPDVPPSRTLLEMLREDLGCTGTKEGCGEGDCGACTVVLGEPQGDGLRYQAVNSCIRLAHSVEGLAVWTTEDLAQDPLIEHESTLGAPSSLHPCQQAMVDCHGSQCGFCTPGFVMSLFGLYQSRVAQGQDITREQAQRDLSGNLCRCTGYRPILDAAVAMAQLPPARVNEPAVRQLMDGLRDTSTSTAYLAPRSVPELLRLRSQYPDAQVVAGCTDVGLWITKGHRQYDRVLDVTRAEEWRQIEHYPHHIAIGAGVNLQDAYSALVAERPQLATFAHRFAGLPVRHSGTLVGNIANGSPIGDSMPLLISLGTNIVLMRWVGGDRGRIAHREMRLEDFYTGYRQNRLAADELVAWVKVPRPTKGEWSRAYKVSKRFDDDISAVCLALSLNLQEGHVTRASIGVGGVAATPVRAHQTERALAGQPWNEATLHTAMATLQAEFQPISDMRASAGYRRQLLGRLLQRAWLEHRLPASVPLSVATVGPSLAPTHGWEGAR